MLQHHALFPTLPYHSLTLIIKTTKSQKCIQLVLARELARGATPGARTVWSSLARYVFLHPPQFADGIGSIVSYPTFPGAHARLVSSQYDRAGWLAGIGAGTVSASLYGAPSELRTPARFKAGFIITASAGVKSMPRR